MANAAVEVKTESKGPWIGIALGSAVVLGISIYNSVYFGTRLKNKNNTTLVDIEAQFWLNLVVAIISFIIFLVALYQWFEVRRRIVTPTAQFLGAGFGTVAGALGGGQYISAEQYAAYNAYLAGQQQAAANAVAADVARA